MLTKKARPKHLNLLKIRLPVTGVVSIIHRITGVILFLSLPFFIFLLALSLRNAETFQQAVDYLNCGLVKLVAAIFVYAMMHHFFAGIRYLLIDLDIGLSLKAARTSAWLVFVLSISLFVFLLVGVVL